MELDEITIQIYSDIHIEIWNKLPEIPVKSKYLFLAGDICPLNHPLFYNFFGFCSARWEKVFYVPGNHEFYSERKNYNELDFEYNLKLKEKYKNVYYLNDTFVELNDEINVYGSIFWTFPTYISTYEAKLDIKDYSYIKYFNKQLNHVTSLDVNFIKELAVILFSEVDDYQNSGYKNKKAGTRIATKYEIYEDIFFRPNIGFQFDTLDVTGNASTLLRSRQGDYVTTSVGYNFLYDQRDSRFNTTSGSILYFDQNIATFFSDIPTVQTGVGATFYKELISDKFIGSAKAKLSNVTAFDDKDVKLSDRIFASPSDLRGFEQRAVGPVDRSDHVGGNNLATLSLKSTFPNPIPENLRATTFLFLDMGNVWGVDYSNLIADSSKLRASTGVALDLMSPIGPLSFTYSIPLSKASTDKEQNFLFNISSSF